MTYAGVFTEGFPHADLWGQADSYVTLETRPHPSMVVSKGYLKAGS